MEQFYVNKHFPRKRIRPSTVSEWTRLQAGFKGNPYMKQSVTASHLVL